MIANRTYDTLFSLSNHQQDWEPFKRFHPDPSVASTYINHDNIDFSIQDQTTAYESSINRIIFTALKIFLFPWGLYEASRYLLGRVVMKVAVNPAILFNQVNNARKSIQELQLQNKDIIIREVVLAKNGMLFTGFVLGNKSTLSNGKWALHARGQMGIAENSVYASLSSHSSNLPYLNAGFNCLFMNNPETSLSGGCSTPDSIGEVQELGLSFLEQAVRAQKIVISGHSLGGAAVGGAILKHKFKQNVKYFVIRAMTFDSLSHIAQKICGFVGKSALAWLGYEMNSVAASIELANAGISELIYTAEEDEVIHKEADLGQAVARKNLSTVSVIHLPGAKHNDLPSQTILEAVKKWDQRAAEQL